MIWLVLGVLIWSGAHLFKRIAPGARAGMGDRAKGPVALALLAALVLMVLGYRMADGAVFWGRSPATVGINNLLMILSVYLFAASGLKTKATQFIRHPQLTAVKAWAVAHLLVNGTVEDLVLFGGILAWAVAEVILINRQTEWTKPALSTAAKELRAVFGTVAVYVGIVLIHKALGYIPYG
ncbi:NnrU family protein [Thalassovita sp.]|uniref:NnrU family protein n=1 Tax=Thalassovita sp. TaxID=1979401 RepID=UPI0029DE5A6A|nr:NnrU family protein [Thalassovita sp.]